MRKIAALFEVLGVLVLGNFAAAYLGPRIGIRPLGLALQSAFDAGQPDFTDLSIVWLKTMFVQYACLLLPAFAIGWWRGRFQLAHYGISAAGQSRWRLAGLGLIAFALAALPFKVLWVVKQLVPLGAEPAMWTLMDRSWTPSFWLFSAIASFAVTPMLEELFFRGYCQTRLEEDFGGIGAIIIVTLFMAFGHNQYHHLSVLSIGSIVGMIPLMLGMGYLYYRTRSLLPAIVLHAAVNVPTKGFFDFLVPAAMIAALILFRRDWLTMVQNFYQDWVRRDWKRTAILAAVAASVEVVAFECWPNILAPLACVQIIIALSIAAFNRSQPA